MDDTEVTQEALRRRYADLAVTASEGAACCRQDEKDSFGHSQYDPQQVAQLPGAAALASQGCGNPTTMADLTAGQVDLDLGPGGGIDVIVSAHPAAPTGKAYGSDMTDDMLDLARRNGIEAGVDANAIATYPAGLSGGPARRIAA